jgi:hypothetical protein
LILDTDGNLKGAYTYAEIPNYDRFWRNLLLGYDSATSTYTALVQTSVSYNVYKLFAFTFSSSSSIPTFLWGFNSVDYSSVDYSNAATGFSIMFAST